MKKSFILVYLILVLAAACAYGQPQCESATALSPCINGVASRQFGQSPNAGALNQSLVSASPNLVEGREFYVPTSIAFDKNASPLIMYVVDTQNNRVLGFQNPNNLAPCGIAAPACGFANFVIGQNNLYGALQGGPTRPAQINAGFALPSAVAVDSKGNVYVVDSGNNRIVRFPRANILSGNLPVTPDLVIGQKVPNQGTSPNEGNSTPSNFSLSLNGAPSGIAIDSSDNVWIADTSNNRVLRFPVANLSGSNPQADLVLGQTGFTTGSLPTPGSNGVLLSPNILNQPLSLVFDGAGRLYVSDASPRVLFFPGPFPAGSNGQSAANLLGIYDPNVIPTQLPTTNQFQLGAPGKSAYCGLFTNGTNLFVVDGGNNRIVEYDQPQNWGNLASPTSTTQPTSQYSPPMIAVIGQTGFNANSANAGNPEPSNSTIAFTTGFGLGTGGGAFNGTDLWIADTGNNRVISMPQTGNAYISATRLVGQLDYPYFQANLIEGRELFLLTNSSGGGGDVAVDLSSGASAPHLYVADTLNNRILGFRDARNIQPGQRADLVIGQQDLPGQPGTAFYRAQANFPKNDPQVPTATGLSQPSGVVVDASGNLWVADTGNARVLRFNAPFNQAAPYTPTLYLGQESLTFSVPGVSQASMEQPFGLAIFSNGSLAVSDPSANRILIFNRPAGGDFQSGQAANVVLGQATFNNSSASNAASGLNVPRHIAVDSDDELYVADTGNNRLSVFNSPPQTDASAFTLSGISVLGVAVSGSGQTDAGIGQGTGEIFLALSNGQVWKYPSIDVLQSNPTQAPEQVISLQATPTALTLDRSGNLVVADASNRLVFYYPQLFYMHAASLNSQPVAPGQLTYLYRGGLPFSFNGDYVSTSYPWPTTANDIQVTVGGTAAPIYLIINEGPYLAIQVPTTAPTSGTVDVVITHPSTGEIVGAVSMAMAPFNPGFFTINDNGTGQVAATNAADGLANSSTDGVSRSGNGTIRFCLTGAGPFTGGPPDGSPYTGAGAPTSQVPQLINGSIGGQDIVPANEVTYSGAGLPGHGCDFPGGWEIDWVVDSRVPPGSSLTQAISVRIGGITPTTAGPVFFSAK